MWLQYIFETLLNGERFVNFRRERLQRSGELRNPFRHRRKSAFLSQEREQQRFFCVMNLKIIRKSADFVPVSGTVLPVNKWFFNRFRFTLNPLFSSLPSLHAG
jgi:hypothetical protein